MEQPITFLRLPKLQDRFPLGRETLYLRIRCGTLPPPIRIGARASAWIASEIEAVAAAVAAGQSNDQLRELVERLVASRGAEASAIGADCPSDEGAPSRGAD